MANIETNVLLARGARYIGWDVMCLGRAGSGERFQRGHYRNRVTILRAGKPLWVERGGIEAGGLQARSAAGLGGKTVCGTMLAVAENLEGIDLVVCRAVTAEAGETSITRLPGLMVVRYLGESSEAARRYFAAVWEHLRPVIAARAAVTPRIWNT